MTQSIAVVGAGILGQTLALALTQKNFKVSIYEKTIADQFSGASPAAGGMLAPFCEMETAESTVFTWGQRCLEMWPQYLALSQSGASMRQRGSLVIASPGNLGMWEDLKRRIAHRAPVSRQRVLDQKSVAELEPELGDRFEKALFLPHEAHLDVPSILVRQREAIIKTPVTQSYFGQAVEIDTSGGIIHGKNLHKADWVIDCRGIGARDVDLELRGVRGEALLVEAPDVHLNRPVRMLHPRYPAYIVPRGRNQYFIGATSIERDETNPITVRSTIELLSTAFSIHPGFAEASVLKTYVGLRPAYPDHLPRIRRLGKVLRVNGLYRHGFLLTPIIVESITNYLVAPSATSEAAPIAIGTPPGNH